MSQTKLNSTTLRLSGDSTYYQTIYRIAAALAEDNQIDGVNTIEMSITDRQASIRYKTAGLMDMLSGMGANIYELVENHPAISAAIITYIMSKAMGKDGAMGNAIEAFIVGYVCDSPMAGVGAGMTDGFLGSILAGAGGMMGDGLLKSILGDPAKKGLPQGSRAPAYASYKSNNKYAADDAFGQAASLIGKLQSSGMNDPLQMLAYLEKSMGGSFSSILSNFMGDFTKTIGEFFSKIFDGGATQQVATQAVDNNPQLAKKIEDKKKEADKLKTSTGQVKTSTGDQEISQVQPQQTPTDPTAQPQETGLMSPDPNAQPTNESTLQPKTPEMPMRNASAQYTNPFRTIFTKRA